MKTSIRKAVISSRRDYGRRWCLLPMKSKTEAQRKLMEKHGSPFAFAKACINAIGEISIGEADAAIKRYNKEWREAT